MRWVRKDRRVSEDAHCLLCGCRWGIGLGQPRVCRPTECLLCGSTQCAVNGLGRGQCGICLIGLLGEPWSLEYSRKRCSYAGCERTALARADGQKPLRCRLHLDRGKWIGWLERTLAERTRKWEQVEDDPARFPLREAT